MIDNKDMVFEVYKLEKEFLLNVIDKQNKKYGKVLEFVRSLEFPRGRSATELEAHLICSSAKKLLKEIGELEEKE